MIQSFRLLNKSTDFLDKILIVFISLIPLSLAISIFAADLLTSLSGLILIAKFFEKKSRNIFYSIKREAIYFILLYLIIIISLILTNYKEKSFLASFFYFRYFFLSVSIFYLLKKYDLFFEFFYKTFFLSIGLVIIDALFQYAFGFNLLGYKVVIYESGDINYISGFFNEEKKLGSYLVRFFPLILGIIYFLKPKISTKIEFTILITISLFILLASERTALFLLLVIYFFYFLISTKKIIFVSFIIIVFSLFFSFEKSLLYKYVNFTLEQTGLDLLLQTKQHPIDKDIIRYYSYEHENLSYTGLVAFKKNFMFGTGVKSFYSYCNDKIQKFQFADGYRNNRLVCSTHPHNTYVQILSEIGIFGFCMIFFLFLKIMLVNLKILLTRNKDNIIKSYFFLNLSIIINLMPLIPSGSFFNNWICLIIFFPIGFWLYVKDKITK